ncbi:ATP-binding cassette sub-family A member 12 [Bagarius yarrelli]|uniref:ATP-binding cassette sub-family A member 12 n=1 Tax=Bagarius yarrelli TaxID=175774 RepID=A0A556V8L6_BAGYA|nr:ATP-binding cassette sub-family A member 12 [Bagarius yarrelli]
MTASFVIYEVHEHHTGSKRLQHISGISEPFYWIIVNFFYDMLPAFTDRLNLSAVSLLLVFFGFASFPWMYLVSAMFKDTEMAFISYVCINLFISMNSIISTAIMYFLGQANPNNQHIQEVYRTLSTVFLVFPQFCFGNGLMELARVDLQVQILSTYGVDAYKNPFGMDFLGWMFVALFLQGFICFTLRLLMNKWLLRKVRRLFRRRRPVPHKGSQDVDIDEDVLAERQRVDSGAAGSDLLQVSQLSKVYRHLKRRVQAVKKLSFGIPAGECFGLLGVNGAGKTTTFKMLTGDISPTHGSAQVLDWDGRMVDIMDCRTEGVNIGYCPQVDALDDLLTGEEHLYFYARIRGICKREIDQVVNFLLKKLELNYHRHIISERYSCGTRRKLSTALALIGQPQILLLIISEQVMGKCAVVLTSHRFGSGFTVKMYLTSSSCNVDSITTFMQLHFPSTFLKYKVVAVKISKVCVWFLQDHHSSLVEYHVPVAPGGVADIFDQLETNKAALQIKHFSVSQTTLDQVFINFAMGKVDTRDEDDDHASDEDDPDAQTH